MSQAQTLPVHDPIDVLIVSDEVNPHGLGDADLMQPGDLSSALNSAATLNTNTITEVATNDIEQATALLSLASSDANRPEVLIYFAHRIPNNGNNASGRQAAFVSAVEQFLQTGGGVISFHHGIYMTTGKQAIQDLLGSEATGAVPWDTVNGQDVIFVGGDHFIGSHQINYTGTTTYDNPSHGIALNNYPYFNNTPDERYPQMDFNLGATSCDIENLFESNYPDNGNQHLLGYTLQCPDWLSKVVVYQPGEYQPNATTGNNFQILLNAIYHVTAYRWDVIFTAGFETN
ncbi:hypothetical protein [Marinicella litoralis]|uniref:ThuA-like domain-containing protein n=2 Tax=Marinicella litoralis TaxID=644220 RepID=A0A4R6XL95_9GAMM|nr:hypothetical protein [Marinicella litoralis]TDR20372.1 hypothetical protein C8D91_1344 [Marinicella litoralis]